MPARDAVALPPHLEARYGRRRTSPIVVAIGLLLAVAAVGALAMIGWRVANPDVRHKLLTWRIVDDARTDVTFEVRRAGSAAVTCVVRAQDGKRQDVGYALVALPADGRSYVQLTYPLATNGRAYVVEVLGCGVGGAPRDAATPQFPPGRSIPAQAPPGTAPAG